MSWLTKYKSISKSIKILILAEFFLQLINTSYFLILNFFLVRHGYDDQSIAELISYRFLFVMLLSLPFGFLIPKKRLLPIFRIASVCIPLASFLILWAAPQHNSLLLTVRIGLIGVSSAAIQVIMVPFIMRNERSSHRSEAVALHFTTWSITSFLLGVFSFGCNWFLDKKLPESFFLYLFTIIGFTGVVLAMFPIKEVEPDAGAGFTVRDYDWKSISQVLAPSFIIGIGAGLTIPFINLFFLNVFGIQYDEFAMIGAASTLLVTMGSIYGPRLQSSYGNRVAITLTQSLAVMALIVLALTEPYAAMSMALPLAVFCYLIRQPLMNMANPIIATFVMDYVGKENREITSALQQALWAGSWFFSTQIFKLLRSHGFSYMSVFLSTAFIYGVGVIWYHMLIRKKECYRAIPT